MRLPRSGTLLVARPVLGDPNFRRTVVLLFRHEPSGSLGLILNRQSGVRVVDTMDDHDGMDGRADVVWFGGPVGMQTMWILHRRRELRDRGVLVLPGVHLGSTPRLLRGLMQSTPANPAPGAFRVLRGYAGWGEGQLDQEIAEGAWLVADADPDVMFGVDPDDLWDDVMTRAQLPFSLPADAVRNARFN